MRFISSAWRTTWLNIGRVKQKSLTASPRLQLFGSYRNRPQPLDLDQTGLRPIALTWIGGQFWSEPFDDAQA